MLTRTQWEYKTLEFDSKGFVGGVLDITRFDESLNAAGRDGWELVSVFTTNQAYGSSRKVIAVFKRPR